MATGVSIRYVAVGAIFTKPAIVSCDATPHSHSTTPIHPADSKYVITHCGQQELALEPYLVVKRWFDHLFQTPWKTNCMEGLQLRTRRQI